MSENTEKSSEMGGDSSNVAVQDTKPAIDTKETKVEDLAETEANKDQISEQKQPIKTKIIIHSNAQHQKNIEKSNCFSLDSMMVVSELPSGVKDSKKAETDQKTDNPKITSNLAVPVVKTAISVPHCVVIKNPEVIKTKIPSVHSIIAPPAVPALPAAPAAPSGPKQIIDILAQNTQVQTAPREATVRIIRAQPHRIASLKISNPPPQLPPQSDPFPELPSEQEVLKNIEEINQEIEKLQEKIKYLEKEKEYSMISVPDVKKAAAEAQVLDFHGIIFSNNCSKSVLEESKKLAEKSHRRMRMPESSITHQFKHVTQCPRYINIMEDSDENAEDMFRVINNEAEQDYIYKRNLTAQYIARKEQWEESNEILSDYHSEAGTAVNQWPAEFAIAKLKGTDDSVRKGCSKDLPMYLKPSEKEAMTYYDENMLVEDPVKEHEEYKNRLTWTDEEKAIFLDKYAHHPRDFKKIAAALPMKSTKDVIEYYHIYRKKLDLHQLDVAMREKIKRRMDAKHK